MEAVGFAVVLGVVAVMAVASLFRRSVPRRPGVGDESNGARKPVPGGSRGPPEKPKSG
jgi:hypothetical protein